MTGILQLRFISIESALKVEFTVKFLFAYLKYMRSYVYLKNESS